MVKKSRIDRYTWKPEQVVLLKRDGEQVAELIPPVRKRRGSGKKPPGLRTEQKRGKFITVDDQVIFIKGQGD